MIYLDSSATNPLLETAKQEMIKLMDLSSKVKIANPSSLHTPGITAKKILENSRKEVAKLINARPHELVFTSGGSESNNTVINIFRNETVFISKIEHPSILVPAEHLAKDCIKIPVSETGEISLSFLEQKLEEKLTKKDSSKILISVQTANNETGTLEPLEKISDLVQKYRKKGLKKLFFHTDATQAAGKINLDVKSFNPDYLTFSSHKLGGPVGIGALYAKSGSPFVPLIFGGSQENKRRAGTSNVILARGFELAVKNVAKNNAIANYQEKILPLRNYLAKELKKQIPSAKIITPLDNSLPNILNVSFPAAEGESTQLYLDLENIYVSTGSACASGDLEPSHVLMAMFHDPEVAHNSVRFSLRLDTTKDDVDTVLEKLPPIINRLQKISTLKIKEQK